MMSIMTFATVLQVAESGSAVLGKSCTACHLKHTHGNLGPGVQPVCRVQATSSADAVVVSPKSY